MKQLTLLTLMLLLMLSNCKSDKQQNNKSVLNNPKEIIHLSHTRSDVAGQIPDFIPDIDFSAYQVRCLGGDLDQTTSKDSATMEVWNQLFDFKSDHTIWAWGNHDDSNPALLTQFTGRPSYFSYTHNQVSYLTLNTQLDSSRITGNQLSLLEHICDTIADSKTLIVLTHKLLWMPGHPELESMTDSIANAKLDLCSYCTQPNNFYEDVYPRLLQVKKRGIQVLCIAGDIGSQVQEFEYRTEDGIYFLASGMSYKAKRNKALLLYFDKDKTSLDWHFEFLENL